MIRAPSDFVKNSLLCSRGNQENHSRRRADLRKERIVAIGSDGYDALRGPRLSDRGGKISHPLVGRDALAVSESELLKVPHQISGDVDSCDNQGAEKVAFAAFVNAEMWLEHLGL